MTFISLTNAVEDHKDDPIVLNTDYIVTVYASPTSAAKKTDGVIEKITYVFCPPHGTWQVQESVEEVFRKIQETK